MRKRRTIVNAYCGGRWPVVAHKGAGQPLKLFVSGEQVHHPLNFDMRLYLSYEQNSFDPYTTGKLHFYINQRGIRKSVYPQNGLLYFVYNRYRPRWCEMPYALWDQAWTKKLRNKSA